MEAYIFRAYCHNVVDGDTIDCKVDVGFGMSTLQRFRLWGLDCPEKRSANPDIKSKAYEAQEFTASLVFGKDIMIQTYKAESFGRYLAKVFILDEGSTTEYSCLNDLLILEGLAIPYMTKVDLLR